MERDYPRESDVIELGRRFGIGFSIFVILVVGDVLSGGKASNWILGLF